MSASREWTEWHLTPSGWQRGSKETDFAPSTKVEPPEDRVLSCIYKETVASSYGGFGAETEIKWSSDNNELIARLKKKYGRCPKRL